MQKLKGWRQKCQKVALNSFRPDTTHFYDVSRSFDGLAAEFYDGSESFGETWRSSGGIRVGFCGIWTLLDEGRTSPGELSRRFGDGRGDFIDLSPATGGATASPWMIFMRSRNAWK